MQGTKESTKEVLIIQIVVWGGKCPLELSLVMKSNISKDKGQEA